LFLAELRPVGYALFLQNAVQNYTKKRHLKQSLNNKTYFYLLYMLFGGRWSVNDDAMISAIPGGHIGQPLQIYWSKKAVVVITSFILFIP
jgi:hypothetical protein